MPVMPQQSSMMS